MRLKTISSVIIVLGQALMKNDSIISMLPSHESRVEKAYDIYNNVCDESTNNTIIILSGGDIKGHGITEASLMYKKLIDLDNNRSNNSIEDILILEEKANNTVENAINCYNIIQSNENFDNCTIHIISNEFHIPRVKCIFNCVFNRCYNLKYCAADSRLKKYGKYRVQDKRQGHPDKDWLLCERLDFEHNAIISLNSYLEKYELNVTKSDIDNALNELRTLNETLK